MYKYCYEHILLTAEEKEIYDHMYNQAYTGAAIGMGLLLLISIILVLLLRSVK